MKISELATKTGVSPYRIRYYESAGLILAQRNQSGYRVFSESATREVRFVAKCREVGIPLKQIAQVLPAYRAGTLTFDDMVELMHDQIARVDQEISELRRLRQELVLASKWFKNKKRHERGRQTKNFPKKPERASND